jgi:hypothetical protein
MLSAAVNHHIQLYKSMGFKYKVQAYMLHSFAAFAESRAERFIQTDTFWNGRKALRRSVSVMIVCSPSAAWPVHSMRKTSDIRCLRIGLSPWWSGLSAKGRAQKACTGRVRHNSTSLGK